MNAVVVKTAVHIAFYRGTLIQSLSHAIGIDLFWWCEIT